MTERKTRVLFVAWGHSIHAERRIGLFTPDPAFDVAVVSNYHYAFKGAKNYLLTAARSTGTPVAELAAEVGPRRAPRVGLAKKAYRAVTRLPAVGSPLHEAVTSARDFRILRGAVREFKPEVIFLQTLMYPCYLALLLPPAIPQVVTFWNGDVVWWAQLTGAERAFKKRIVTRGVRRAAALTVNSQAALGKCLDYGAKPHRVHLIRYPGVNTQVFFPGDRADAKRGLGLDSRLILAPRGPAAYQNLDVLVRAAPAVLRRFPGAKFMFLTASAGDTPAAFETYRRLADELGVAQAMLWRGNVPHAELPALYRAADAVVSLSSEDSLPNVMLEAMACRAPLLVGDIAPVREWIENEVNGLAVDPRDPEAVSAALVRLLENQDKLVDRFVEASQTMVIARAAGPTQIQLVKDLVHQVARATRTGE